MKNHVHSLLATVLIAALTCSAQADVTIGFSLPLTGAASSNGIQTKRALALWPKSIGGESLNLIVLDDATDPTQGVKNTRRFVSEDKVDLLVGSVATPTTIAMSDVATEAETVLLALSPMEVPEGKGLWAFRLPQLPNVMAGPIVEQWKKAGVKTFAFLGWADAYGESWLKAITALTEKAGIKNVSTERFGRADTSVTGQALKVVGANPDVVLVVAAGSGAAMPHKALVERGFAKTKIYQTHGAATMDLIRLGGKDVEGALLVAGPAVVPSLLPDSNPSKATGIQYVHEFEKMYGPHSATQFSAHAYDVALILKRIIPIALKKAKPGTREFRIALKDALETMGRTPITQGVLNYSPTDHFGYSMDTGVMLTIANGDWKLAPTN